MLVKSTLVWTHFICHGHGQEPDARAQRAAPVAAPPLRLYRKLMRCGTSCGMPRSAPRVTYQGRDILPSTLRSITLLLIARMQTGAEAGAAPVFVREFQEPLPSDPRFDVVRFPACVVSRLIQCSSSAFWLACETHMTRSMHGH